MPQNMGTRIDYKFCSKRMVSDVIDSVMSCIYGIDCPVYADFGIDIPGKNHIKSNLLAFF